MENNIDPTLLAPKEVTISGKQFLLSKLPAIAGRETLLAYTESMDSATGEIQFAKVPLEKSLRLISFASVKIGEGWQRLSTDALVNAHISNVGVYMELEKLMLNHSLDFS
jgi:hypothetical protein